MTNNGELIRSVQAGEVRALSRLCRRLEQGRVDETAMDVLLGWHPRAWTVGVTGSPGAGKSSLVARLVAEFRKEGQRVGVVAVDPTSPFSGGAVLGDRIRMQQHFEDPEVFIRSLATRGALGGLATASFDIVLALGLWGANVILVETVGVGQAELDVMDLCDTTLVVAAPGMGDDVQAAKAGILEIADVLAVNKSDQPDAARTLADLQGMLALGRVQLSSRDVTRHTAATVLDGTSKESDEDGWEVPLLSTCATDGSGMSALFDALRAHRRWLDAPRGAERQTARAERRMRRRLEQLVTAWFERRHGDELGVLAHELAARRLGYGAARRRLLSMLGDTGPGPSDARD